MRPVVRRRASLHSEAPFCFKRIGTAVKALNWLGDDAFPVWVQPRAGRNQVIGLREGALHGDLNAPPVEGRANESLVRFLSEVLEIRQNQVVIVSGERSRHKIVRIAGLAPEELRRRLEKVLLQREEKRRV